MTQNARIMHRPQPRMCQLPQRQLHGVCDQGTPTIPLKHYPLYHGSFQPRVCRRGGSNTVTIPAARPDKQLRTALWQFPEPEAGGFMVPQPHSTSMMRRNDLAEIAGDFLCRRLRDQRSPEWDPPMVVRVQDAYSYCPRPFPDAVSGTTSLGKRDLIRYSDSPVPRKMFPLGSLIRRGRGKRITVRCGQWCNKCPADFGPRDRTWRSINGRKDKSQLSGFPYSRLF
jgi:hypothetical protein